jgi:hypothetical protein
MQRVPRRSLLKAAIAALSYFWTIVPAGFARARSSGMMGNMGGMMGDGMNDMMGPMMTGMQLFRRHDQIRRTVTVLPNGVQAETESDDPDVAMLIQEHVTSMYARIDQDRPFSYPMSRTVPALFRNTRRYHRQLLRTAKGIKVIETSEHADMVELIKAHAQEISGFVAEGMPAMMGR